MRKPETQAKWAESLAEAQRVSGITRQTLAGYKKAGCPAFKANGRIHLGELAEWMAVHGKDAGRVPESVQAARIRLLTAQAVRTERENKIRSGELVDRAELRTATIRIQTQLFDTLERVFCQELPPDLKGLDERDIARRCVEAVDTLREELRAKFAAMASESTAPAAGKEPCDTAA